MTARQILRMGDPRLLQPAQPVETFGTPELAALIEDMFDTMAAAGGVGLAAPQIGVGLQLVIFGFERSARYPEAPPVPRTILLNPVVTPLDDDIEDGWEGCLSVPGLRGLVPRHRRIRYQGRDPQGEPGFPHPARPRQGEQTGAAVRQPRPDCRHLAVAADQRRQRHGDGIRTEALRARGRHRGPRARRRRDGRATPRRPSLA